MPQSVYSFLGSPLHLVLEDSIAEGYNQFVDAFLEAQKHHREVFGTPWDPTTDALMIKAPKEAHDAYNKVGKLINLLVEINGGGIDIPEEQCTSDHLEKVV